MSKLPTEVKAETQTRVHAIVVSQGGLYANDQFVATNPVTAPQVAQAPPTPKT